MEINVSGKVTQKVHLGNMYEPIKHFKDSPLYATLNLYIFYLPFIYRARIHFTLFFVAETPPSLTVEKPSIMEGTKNK